MVYACQHFFGRRIYLLILFCSLFSVGTVFSQEDYKTSRQFTASEMLASLASTGPLVKLESWDEEINVPNHNSISPRAFVRLMVNLDQPPFVWYKTTVTADIEPILPDGTPDVAYSHTFTVEYNPNSNSSVYEDQSYHQIEGRYGAKVKITSVSTEIIGGSTTATVLENTLIEVGFETQRDYLLTEQMPVVSASVLMDDNDLGGFVPVSLKLNWDNIVGAMPYEVEWTWVDNYGNPIEGSAPTAIGAGSINFSSRDFEKNCTRIQTIQSFYEIPLIYSNGYIIYRVRGVGRYLDDRTKTFYGPWSTGLTTKQLVSDWAPSIYLVQAHENNKNWQFQSSYAEEGKKKEVVSYFDGSLRNRQTVTRNNSDQNAVAGEVVYDNQGRAAIEILPVPLYGRNYIRYFNNLNVNASGLSYSHLDFDWDDVDNLCNIAAAPMDNANGASRYYSKSNEFTSRNINFIPDAYGYPFSHTEYTPDNTGRIQRKGGVGQAHQLNTRHEMQYFYDTPYQEELNRLFGYHVGYASHYKKNIVIDPNGQASVSYIDPQGKTIATALAARHPQTMLPLEETLTGNHNQKTADLLNNNHPENLDTATDNNILGSTSNFPGHNDKLTFSRQIIALNSEHNFHYKIKNDNFFTADRCDDKYAFVYDLKLSLKDQCADEKFPLHESHPAPDFKEYIRQLGVQYIGSSPGTINPEISIDFETLLHQEPHSLLKELKVNQDVLNFYADAYIDKVRNAEGGTNCYLDPVTFAVPAAYLNPQDCYTDCLECRNGIGTKNAFIVSQLKAHYNNQTFAILNPATPTVTFTNSATDINLEEDIDQEDVTGLIVQFAANWEKLNLSCNMLCQPSFGSDCLGDEQALLTDVSPSGQYGAGAVQTNAPISPPEFGVTDELSVFNTDNVLYSGGTTTGHNWRNPATPYKDDQGNESLIEVQLVEPGVYNPEILTGVVPVISTETAPNGDPILTVRPEQLLHVSDFLNTYWKATWAQSLVQYHPEYCYLEYSKELCSNTKELSVVKDKTGTTTELRTLNSGEYDSYLDYLDTFQAAVNANFATSGGISTAIFTLDPYFDHAFDTDFETSGLYTARKGIMDRAITLDYEGHGNTMLEEAYKTVLCNAVTTCSPGTVNFSSLTAEQKDRVWNTYKSFYRSLKNKIRYVFMSAYAIKNNCYNECIGGVSAPFVTNIVNKYPQSLTVFAYIFANPSTAPLCGSSSAFKYQSKIKRFIPIDNGYDSGVSEGDSMAQMSAQAQYQIYAETGVCPLLFDLEIFMDDFFKTPPSSLHNNNQPINQYLTAALFKGFTNVAVPVGATSRIHTDLSASDKVVSFSFANVGTSVTTSMKLTIPSPSTGTASTLTWANLGTAWTITDFKHFYYNGSGSNFSNPSNLSFAFNVVAVIQLSGGAVKEIVLSGTTIAAIGDCGIFDDGIGQVLDYNSATSDDAPGCTRKYKFKKAMLKLLNDMKAAGTLFSGSPVALNDIPAYTQSFLPAFFEDPLPTTSTWSYSSGVFTITRGGGSIFTMQVTLPAASTIYHFDGFTIGTPNNNSFSLYFTDTSGVMQHEEGVFNNNILFSCCGVKTNIVPVFALRQQISTTVTGGHLFYSDRVFTPKNISIPQNQEVEMSFYVNKSQVADTFEGNLWQPEIVINGETYNFAKNNLSYYSVPVAYNNDERLHKAPINRLSWKAWWGAPLDMNRMEYKVNSTGTRIFELNGDGLSNISGMSLTLKPAGNTTFWNAYGLSLNSPKDAEWNDAASAFDFNQPTEIFFKTKMKFTGNLPYYDNVLPGYYFGHIAQLDSELASNPIYMYQLLVTATNQTEELCTPCIPQTVNPVSCNDKYADYITFLNFNSEDYSTMFPDIKRDEIYTEAEFCNRNLGFLVDSYISYINTMGVSTVDNVINTEHPRYLTISQFGDTNLNYGYSGMAAVITAYQAYLASTLPVDPEAVNDEAPTHVGWNEFVDKIYMSTHQICPPAPMYINSLIIDEGLTPCEQMMLTLAETYQDDAYNNYLTELRENFIKRYIKEAMGKVGEQFDLEYFDKEYQYTLYYYDQAGNLIRTVAPQGVNRIDGVSNTAIDEFRDAPEVTENTTLLPDHKFDTAYKYNSLNQLVYQKTPDGGEVRFAYDALGRIIASQNDNQAPKAMSYTIYDELGRITESGQVRFDSGLYTIDSKGRLISGGNIVNSFDVFNGKSEVTKTLYDQPVLINPVSTEYPDGNFSTSLFVSATNNNTNRNRVTGVLHYDNYNVSNQTAFNNGIFYNYDIHGNVKEVVNYYANLLIDQTDCGLPDGSIPGVINDCEAHLKRTVYEYDLISGNVKQVTFQPNRPNEKSKRDLFIHKYNYDADNRITNVQTSSDGVIWEQDAEYEYYPHGPLARMEIGEHEVQGIDYAYTLQGWLKAVNGEDLSDPLNTMGTDGANSDDMNKDAFGYSLSYYDAAYDNQNVLLTHGDYKKIRHGGDADIFALSQNPAIQPGSHNLYNGNIKKMTTAIREKEDDLLRTQVNKYRYDQLNRISEMTSSAVDTKTGNVQESYNASYGYDKNGNLQALNRNVWDKDNINGGSPYGMDKLTYQYAPGTNKLIIVRDGAATPGLTSDLEDQVNQLAALGITYSPGVETSHNYRYDPIGQLIEDQTERLKITWRADGKVKTINKRNGEQIITFDYDGLGNRIAKIVNNLDGKEITTVYARDAQGNVLGVYDITKTTAGVKIMRIIENDIYGSSRLGIENKDTVIFEQTEALDRKNKKKAAAAKKNAAIAASGAPAPVSLLSLPPVDPADLTYYALELSDTKSATWTEPGTAAEITEDYTLESKFKIDPNATPDSNGDIFIGKAEFEHQDNVVTTHIEANPIDLAELSIANNIATTSNLGTFTRTTATAAASARVDNRFSLVGDGYIMARLNSTTARAINIGLSYENADDNDQQTMLYKAAVSVSSGSVGMITFYKNFTTSFLNQSINYASNHSHVIKIERVGSLIKFYVIATEYGGTASYHLGTITDNTGGRMFLEFNFPAQPGNTGITGVTVVNNIQTNEVITPITGIGTGSDQLKHTTGSTSSTMTAPSAGVLQVHNGYALAGATTAFPSLVGDGYVERTLTTTTTINNHAYVGLSFSPVTSQNSYTAMNYYDSTILATGPSNRFRFGVLGGGFYPSSGGSLYVAGDRMRVERRDGVLYMKRITSDGVETVYARLDLTPTEATAPMYLMAYMSSGAGNTTEIHNLRICNYIPLTGPGSTRMSLTGMELKVNKTLAGYSPKVKVNKGAWNYITNTYNNAITDYSLPAITTVTPDIMEHYGMQLQFSKAAAGAAQFLVNGTTYGTVTAASSNSSAIVPAASQIGPSDFDMCYFNYQFGTGITNVASGFDFTNNDETNPILTSGEPAITVFEGSSQAPTANKVVGPCLTDQDNDGIYDIYENVNQDNDLANDDTDQDGIPNYLDNDDDGDSVWTVYEILNTDGDYNPATGPSLNTDNDSIPNYLDNDDDNDTVYTQYEVSVSGSNGNPGITPVDTDSDSIPNYLDLDDDNDGYATWETTETVPGDSDHNPFTDMMDSDLDGIPNHIDRDHNLYPPAETPVMTNYQNVIGDKSYELANHLGNVLVVVNDKKIPELDTNGDLVYFNADIESYSDYYPFGSLLPGRHFVSEKYRYGFQGQEMDDEVKGEGNSIDLGERIHDPRVGRFFAIDPLSSKYPYYSPYQFAGNTPIVAIDADGLEDIWTNEKRLPDGTRITEQIFKGDEYYEATRQNWAQMMGLDVNLLPNDGALTTAVSYKFDGSMELIDKDYQKGVEIISRVGNPFTRALRKADSWLISVQGDATHEGNDWIDSFNAGVKFSYEANGYTKEYEFGVFSTDENSAGLYSTITTSIGVKVSSDSGVNLLRSLSVPEIVPFAKANTGNPFNDPTFKNDTKVSVNGSVGYGPINITGSGEYSLKDGSTSQSYGVEFGKGPRVKVEGAAVNSTTIFFRTKEVDLTGNK